MVNVAQALFPVFSTPSKSGFLGDVDRSCEPKTDRHAFFPFIMGLNICNHKMDKCENQLAQAIAVTQSDSESPSEKNNM